MTVDQLATQPPARASPTAVALDDAVTVPTPARRSTAQRRQRHSVDVTGDGTLAGPGRRDQRPANGPASRATAVKVVADGSYRLLDQSADHRRERRRLHAHGRRRHATCSAARPSRAGARRRRSPSAPAITVTSATNTFADVIPGVDLTLAADRRGGAVDGHGRAATPRPMHGRGARPGRRRSTRAPDIDRHQDHAYETGTTPAGGCSPATHRAQLRSAAPVGTVFAGDRHVAGRRRHPARPRRQADLRRGRVRRRPTRPTPPPSSRRLDRATATGFAARVGDGRQGAPATATTGTITTAITGRNDVDRAASTTASATGTPPRAAPDARSSGSTPPSRPRSVRHEQPVQLAGRPDSPHSRASS